MENAQKAKTRQQIADEFGISRKTLYNWLKRENITMKNGLIMPKEQEIIYEKLGRSQVNNHENPGQK